MKFTKVRFPDATFAWTDHPLTKKESAALYRRVVALRAKLGGGYKKRENPGR
jgi:hypothetical protein